MPAPKPSVRFPLPPSLRVRTLKVLSKIDTDSEPTRHTEDLCALTIALTESGMDHYFLKAVTDAKLGFVARQTASLGVKFRRGRDQARKVAGVIDYSIPFAVAQRVEPLALVRVA